MAGKLCIMVCENFRREIAAIVSDEEFADVVVQTFPAICDRPGVNWDILREAIDLSKEKYDRIDFVGGCCFAGLADPPEEMGHCRVRKLDQCFRLFASETTIYDYQKRGYHLLTPGWLAHWQDYIQSWGFDRETAREFFKEAISRLLLLDTKVDEAGQENLQALAGFLSLPYDIMPVGLDFFRLYLAGITLQWRLDKQKSEAIDSLAAAGRQAADHAMAFDMIGNLTRIMTEAEAIESVFDLFTMMFAPGSLAYVSVNDSEPEKIQLRPSQPADIQTTRKRLSRLSGEYAWTESGDGFMLRIEHQGETLGVLEVAGIPFPQYIERYLNLSLTIGRVCGLAVANARTFERMKRTEETLANERERLSVTLRSIGDGVIATDTQGKVVLINQVTEYLTGWTQEDAFGRPIEEIFQIINEKTRVKSENPVVKALAEGTVVGLANHTALIAKDGTERSIADSAAPIRDRNGNILGVVLVFRDVTEQKQAERLREEYVSLISHDLRNPLTTIMAHADWLRFLLTQKEAKKELDSVEVLLRSARRMNAMIQDLIESARLESGQIELQIQPTNIMQFLSELTERVGSIDDRERVRLNFSELVPPVLADPNRIERAIMNFITNALKYSSPESDVIVQVEAYDGQAVLSVRDQGVGIPPEDLPFVFDRFYRAKTGRRSEGLGLGLYIARLIVEAHGGRTWVESEVGKGSTFFLSLPLA